MPRKFRSRCVKQRKDGEFYARYNFGKMTSDKEYHYADHEAPRLRAAASSFKKRHPWFDYTTELDGDLLILRFTGNRPGDGQNN